MKNTLPIVFLIAFLATGFCTSSVFAQTIQTPPDTQSLISQLQSQIQALQTRINELEAELGVQAPASEAGIDGQTLPERHVGASIPLPSFIQTLSLGSRGDDVRNLQTFLSQFKDIYPEGLITGYFGPLTEKAVQRWQTKHNIVTSGTSETTGYGRIGPKTRAKLNELITEEAGRSGVIPPGLLKAPGLQPAPSSSTSDVSTSTPDVFPEGTDVSGTTTPAIVATTTPTTTATSTPSGTIPATPATPANFLAFSHPNRTISPL